MVLDQIGGGIKAYTSRLRDQTIAWLLPPAPGQLCCFPMVPFCSRIQSGIFRYQNHSVTLPANNLPEMHAIHGHGWQASWNLHHLERSSVCLRYIHSGQHWPWPYTAELTYALQGATLRIEMEVRNTAQSTMPLGVGMHPFFPKKPGSVLRANVGGWLHLDEEGFPLSIQALPAERDLSGQRLLDELALDGVLLDGLLLDDVFVDWDGQVSMSWPCSGDRSHSCGVNMTSSAPHLVVWAPAGQDFVCVEPVTNLPGALNGAVATVASLVHLAAGESYRVYWQLRPFVS